MIHDVLGKVQSELTVLKSHRNDSGGYSFRNVEDIHAAAKPICAKHGATYFLSDRVVHIGDRYYVEATATFYVGSEFVVVTAYAREQANRKGMEESQVTGSASSYARKYALSGLFAIDNEKDADSMDNRDQGTPERPVSESQLDELTSLIEEFAGLRSKTVEETIGALMGGRTMVNMDAKWDTLTADQAQAAIGVVKGWLTRAKAQEASE